LPSIGPNRVFEDDDGDGIFDAGEKGLSNVLVNLYDSSNSLVATVLTDSNGLYSFVGLNPGTYYISVNKDPDFKFSPVVDGGNQISQSVDSPLLNKSPPVTLAIGMNDKTLLVGMYESANTGNNFGPYYPDWTNDIQVCTNDGYDPSWLEIQKVNYLYDSKEACCKKHFW